jgi:hypothetical protein
MLFNRAAFNRLAVLGGSAELAGTGGISTTGGYGAALTISSAIGATNTLFYAKAKATSDESPANDTSVDLQVQATVAAV